MYSSMEDSFFFLFLRMNVAPGLILYLMRCQAESKRKFVYRKKSNTSASKTCIYELQYFYPLTS